MRAWRFSDPDLIAETPERLFHVHDVFGMIPRPTSQDTEDVQDRYRTISTGQARGIGGDEYYGYTENLFEKVLWNMRRSGVDCASRRVHLVKGLVQETLHPRGAIALAHIDVDWYDPVKTWLERLFRRLSLGGSLILDDYHDWGGCHCADTDALAFREFFKAWGRILTPDARLAAMSPLR